MCLQNLSSCIVLDDDSADETPAVSTASATKQSNFTAFTSDSNLTNLASPGNNYTNSFSASGICNPGFNFEDDENEGDKDDHPRIPAAATARGEGLLFDCESTSETTPVSHSSDIRHHSNSVKPPRNSSVKSDNTTTISEGSSSKPRTTKQSQADDGNDTDEDAASLSISTVSEASTVVPGESFQLVDRPAPPPVPEKKNRKSVKSNNNASSLVSQQPMRRRASVKSQSKLCGEGNVRIVEIKSRDVVQGILKMEPKLASLSGRDHVAIVKVPVASSSHNLHKQKARQQASNNCAGSGSSHESRDGNAINKVRMLLISSSFFEIEILFGPACFFFLIHIHTYLCI